MVFLTARGEEVDRVPGLERLLVSGDNALVLGAGLLFVVLAAIMLLARRIDWYQTSMRPGAR